MDRFDIGRLTDFDISTAAKHGTDLMTAIRDALLGRAWIPPTVCIQHFVIMLV